MKAFKLFFEDLWPFLQEDVAKQTREGSNCSRSSEVDPISKDALDRLLPPDAPTGHPAWHKVTWAPNTLSYRFRDKGQAGKAGQATIAQVGGSCNAASRIARLIYVKATEEGGDNSLFAYRDQLYKVIKDAFPELPDQKQVVQEYKKKSTGRGLKRPAAAASSERTGPNSKCPSIGG